MSPHRIQKRWRAEVERTARKAPPWVRKALEERPIWSLNAEPTRQYRYQPLPTNVFTRVLELSPSPPYTTGVRRPNDVYCKLVTIGHPSRLHDPPSFLPYKAVSYAWGKPDFMEKLWMREERGSYIPVAKPVKDMLRELMNRGRVGPCRIWIDAICIN